MSLSSWWDGLKRTEACFQRGVSPRQRSVSERLINTKPEQGVTERGAEIRAPVPEKCHWLNDVHVSRTRSPGLAPKMSMEEGYGLQPLPTEGC